MSTPATALFLDRIEGLLARMAASTPADAAPAASAPEPEAPYAAAREVARQLALWMCFEDLIRAADLKTRLALADPDGGRLDDAIAAASTLTCNPRQVRLI